MKKILVISFLMLLFAVPYAWAEDNKKGDVDGDGTVTQVDVNLIAQYAAGKSVDGIKLATADINGDGVVTIVDVIAAQKNIDIDRRVYYDGSGQLVELPSVSKVVQLNGTVKEGNPWDSSKDFIAPYGYVLMKIPFTVYLAYNGLMLTDDNLKSKVDPDNPELYYVSLVSGGRYMIEANK